MDAETEQREITLLAGAEALQRLMPDAVAELTQAATGATFHRDNLTAEQLAANRRVVEISTPSCTAAAQNDHQHFIAAFLGNRFAGYVIATRHGPGDHELDWLMVHPDFHGLGVAALLMQAGIEWLGTTKPMWLNVIRYNDRAIRFYRRFGFEIDPHATTGHAIPHWIMRRPAT